MDGGGDLSPIAALFIDPDGPYPTIAGVDCWDEARDARRYPGPYPVVAHPPCQLWVNFAALNFKRYGGDHNRPGFDGGCFASAYHNVLRHGGVLEHPASSNAWEFYGLTKPNGGGVEPLRNRLGLRGVAERVWAPRAEADLAVLQRPPIAARSRLATRSGHPPMRVVRSAEADSEQAGGVSDAGGVRGVPGGAGAPFARAAGQGYRVIPSNPGES